MLLESVVSAEVRIGEREIFLSESHSRLEYKHFRLLNESYQSDTMLKFSERGLRGIPMVKRDSIVSKLCPVIART